eukprot:ANDGO_03464.mRNA.1 Sepiapterin reductase
MRIGIVLGCSRGLGAELVRVLPGELGWDRTLLISRSLLPESSVGPLSSRQSYVSLDLTDLASVERGLHSIDRVLDAWVADSSTTHDHPPPPPPPQQQEQQQQQQQQQQQERHYRHEHRMRFDLVLNAGSVGVLAPFDTYSVQDWNTHVLLNVTSPMVITSHLLHYIRTRFSTRTVDPVVPDESCDSPSSSLNLIQIQEQVQVEVQVRITNISTLLAVQPASSFGMYSTVKAARDMAMRAVAVEASTWSKNDAIQFDVKTLSYAPGPLDTDMMSQILDSETMDRNVHAAFVGMKNQGAVLHVRTTVGVLAKLLKDDSFESGAHVDVYDVYQPSLA